MKKKLLILLLLPFGLYAKKVPYPPEEVQPTPWYTGALITPSGHCVPFGHQNYEPYFYWTSATGSYNRHWHTVSRPRFNNLLFQPVFQFGILPATEFDITPQFIYNNSRGEHMWRTSDIPMSLNFQLHQDFPAVKLKIGWYAPLGKYDRLNAKKLGTDAGGAGDWSPSLGLISSYLVHFRGIHYLNLHTWINYNFTVPVPVHGLSVYGGAPSFASIKGTRGRVYPGGIFFFSQGFEFSLTQNWVLALDVTYQHVNRTRFSGRTPPGTAPKSPASEFFTIAPAVEYNFSQDIGIIAGPWFSVAGRNQNTSPYFISWIFAINIYH